MATGPRGSVLTASTSGTSLVRTASIRLETFDTLVDPCAYLNSELTSRILAEIGAPSTSVLSCTFVSHTFLATGRKFYNWTITASWTE